MAKLQGRFSDGADSKIPPLAVTGLTATDVGTSRPFLATANTTSAASAASTGGAVTLSWTVPSNSTASTQYYITTSPATYTATVTAPATSYTFQGLASGVAYTFTVTPNNTFGNGLATTATQTATTVPNAPTIGTATAGVDSDTVTWTAPNNNGGKAISNYYVLGSDGTSGNTTSTSITIADTANTSQYYNVYADNANGRSAASANSNTVTTLPPSFFSPPFFPPFFPPTFFSPPFFPPFFPPTFFSPPFFPPTFFSPPFFPPAFFSPPGFFSPPTFGGGGFSPPAFYWSNSIEIMTKVLTTDGFKYVSEINIGDTLVSVDIDNNELSEIDFANNLTTSVVTAIDVADGTNYIYIDGDTFTESHNILVKRKNDQVCFVPAYEIVESDKIFSTETKEFVPISLIEKLNINTQNVSITSIPHNNFFTEKMFVHGSVNLENN